MDELLQKLAEALLPAIDKARSSTLQKSTIKKEDPSTWPPKLHEAWMNCAKECESDTYKKINPAKIDTNGGSDDNGGM